MRTSMHGLMKEHQRLAATEEKSKHAIRLNTTSTTTCKSIKKEDSAITATTVDSVMEAIVKGVPNERVVYEVEDDSQ